MSTQHEEQILKTWTTKYNKVIGDLELTSFALKWKASGQSEYKRVIRLSNIESIIISGKN